MCGKNLTVFSRIVFSLNRKWIRIVKILRKPWKSLGTVMNRYKGVTGEETGGGASIFGRFQALSDKWTKRRPKSGRESGRRKEKTPGGNFAARSAVVVREHLFLAEVEHPVADPFGHLPLQEVIAPAEMEPVTLRILLDGLLDGKVTVDPEILLSHLGAGPVLLDTAALGIPDITLFAQRILHRGTMLVVGIEKTEAVRIAQIQVVLIADLAVTHLHAEHLQSIVRKHLAENTHADLPPDDHQAHETGKHRNRTPLDTARHGIPSIAVTRERLLQSHHIALRRRDPVRVRETALLEGQLSFRRERSPYDERIPPLLSHQADAMTLRAADHIANRRARGIVPRLQLLVSDRIQPLRISASGDNRKFDLPFVEEYPDHALVLLRSRPHSR